MELATATQRKVFAAARTATWTTNNLGTHAQVNVGGATYTVTLQARTVLAYIDAVEEWGNTTWITGANATVGEHTALVAAAGI